MDDKGIKITDLSALGDQLRIVLSGMGQDNVTLVEARGDVFVFVNDGGERFEIAMRDIRGIPAAPHIEAAQGTPVPGGIEPALPAAPRMGEALIGLFCGRDRREDMLAVLADKFEEKARDHGGRYARAWYWGQVARSFGPFAWQWARRLIELDEIFRRIGL